MSIESLRTALEKLYAATVHAETTRTPVSYEHFTMVETRAALAQREDEPVAYTAEELSPPDGWTDTRIADALDKAIRIMLPPDDAQMLQYRATIRVMRRAEKRLRLLAAPAAPAYVPLTDDAGRGNE